MNTLVVVIPKKLKSYQLQMRQKKSEINMIINSTGIFMIHIVTNEETAKKLKISE